MTTMDALAQVSGIKPKVLLEDGQEVKMSSMTTDNLWKVKRTGDHYICSCPAWIYQKLTPDMRTCRHLKELFGFNYEQLRTTNKTPPPARNKSATPAPSTKAQGKRKRAARALSVSSESESDADADTANKTPRKKAKRDAPQSSSPNSSIPSSIAVSVLLAQTWKEDKGCDPTGYWISEKLDGVRAYFCKGAFYSRLGNRFFAPDDFSEEWRSKLPKGATLDGELFTGRAKFQETVSIVRSGASKRWPEVMYYVFDAPFLVNKQFEERLAFLKSIFGEPDAPTYANVKVVEHIKCKGKAHVMEMLEQLQNKGAEGLMLRQPKSIYEPKRSSTLLKVKTFYDAEALVLAHHAGSGKNSNVTGAIEVKMACGKTFKIGTGFTDAQRRNPPKIGSIVVYKFQELSKSGTPRFPVYIGEAIDKTEPKDAEIRVVDDEVEVEDE